MWAITRVISRHATNAITPLQLMDSHSQQGVIKVDGAWLHTGQSESMAGFTTAYFLLLLEGPIVSGVGKCPILGILDITL